MKYVYIGYLDKRKIEYVSFITEEGSTWDLCDDTILQYSMKLKLMFSVYF